MIKKNDIPNKQNGEEVIMHLRRHWFVFLKTFLFFVILLFIPVLVYAFIDWTFPKSFDSPILGSFLLVLALSYYLIMLVFMFTAWTEIYLDVWTITTHRIINREQNLLFNRVVSELFLNRIQDVTTEQKGFFPTILHYGDVYIQTAAERERFIFEQIPAPYYTAKIIQKLNEKAKEENPNL